MGKVELLKAGHSLVKKVLPLLILDLASEIKSLRLWVSACVVFILKLFIYSWPDIFFFFSILWQASVSHGRLSGNMNLTQVKYLINNHKSPLLSLVAFGYLKTKYWGSGRRNIFENNCKFWNEVLGTIKNRIFLERAFFALIVAFFRL